MVDLYKAPYKKFGCGVHSVVASAFLGRCPSGKEVNHKDGIKSNPNVTNLEYVTRSENLIHAYRILKHGISRGPDNYLSKLSWKDVADIRNRWISGESLKSICRNYNTTKNTIYQVVINKTYKDENYKNIREPADRPRRPNTKFTYAQAQSIRNERKTTGISLSKLAAKYGLPLGAMHRLVRGVTYKNPNILLASKPLV